MAVLWIDITELFGHFRGSGHATGVARVVLELAERLRRDPGPRWTRAVPVLFDPARLRLVECPHDMPALPSFFAAWRANLLGEGWPDPRSRSRAKRALVSIFPKPARYRLFPSDHGAAQYLARERRSGRPAHEADPGAGDCLFLPGSFWLDGYAPGLVRQATARRCKVAALVHDVLLLSEPQWSSPHDTNQFRRGCEAVLPLCSAIVTNSCHTGAELRRQVGLAENIPMTACRLGDIDDPPVRPAVTPAIEPLLGQRFVLYISTVIARKNHRALIEAWRRLSSVHADATPILVLVGGGAPAIAAGAGDRVVGLADLTDAEREALYGAAWMTAYPSLGEGYGLPVAEALARGIVTIASDRGGLAEIAPGLVDVIDPCDPDTIAAAVGRYLRDPARHDARAREIRQRYTPTGWADTARQVAASLAALA
jgi:glycosyltransferase involved in cell wall biosynthesis